MSDRLKASLRTLAEQAIKESSGHPSPEELVDYHAGRLQPESEDRLQEHLSICPDCTQLLLDLPTFTSPGGEDEHSLSKADLSEAWARVHDRFSSGERNGTPGAKAQRLVPFGLSSAAVPYALAASLAILSITLGIWTASLWSDKRQLARQLGETSTAREQQVLAGEASLQEAKRQLEEASHRFRQSETEIASLRQRVDELSQPQGNVVVAELTPRGFERGDEGHTNIEVPAVSKVITLILPLRGSTSFKDHEVEILDERGQLIWRGQGLRKSPDLLDNFSIVLPRQKLPAGRYRIRLFGRDARRRQPLEDYFVRIRYL
ncbi:MAG: zf-HC2 domain-containing protein [Acidobacteria bacterium]|nr:zf-HC2 domain-containing protein [Acidobacteriota bacterium]